MKKVIILLSFLTSAMYVSAQENPKQKEVGLAFGSLDNFGLTFKTGSEKSLWRFNALVLNGSTSEENEDSLKSTRKYAGFNIGIGKEFRKPITENLELRYGADLSFKYSYSFSDDDDLSFDNHDRLREQKIYEPGLNLVFGINYVYKSKFVFGAELKPGFSYFTGKSSTKNYYSNDGTTIDTDLSGINYGFSNTSALLTMAYRF
jgi:hypothetical protein